MSSRARLAADHAVVSEFEWPEHRTGARLTPASDGVAPDAASQQQQQLATLEREAFAKGFAQGERAGAEAAGKRGDAMLRRLTQTLEEVTQLRAQMIRDTEHQMVSLALAVARRIIQREISLEPDLLMAIARVAMDRLGESARVTVRLNPDDYAATAAAREREWNSAQVAVVADSRLPRGGCRIESDLGTVDASVDAQLHELAHALLNQSAVHVPR